MQQPPDDDDNRPVPQLGSLTAPPERPDLKKRIMESKQKLLNNIKGKFTGEETGRWLDNIDQSPSRADEQMDAGSLIDESQLSMPAFIDMLFDHLQRYVFEYNKIPSNQDNILNVERPHGYQERAEYGSQSLRVKYMRGHLSSRTWSMLVDALDEEISLYIVPTEFLIGFEPTSDFEPYVAITKEMGMTSVMWTINGKRLGVEELTRLARKLITHLVKVIKGEAQSTEKFSFSPNENRFVEEPVSPDRSFEQIPESDVGLHRAAKDTYAPSYAPIVALPPMPAIPEVPAMPQTRSGMLKRLMDVAQEEEQEARTLAMSGVRQLTSRAAIAAPAGVAQAGSVKTLPKPPGALGAPAAPGMPTPGAFGQGGNGPPGGFSMPTPPGAVGSVGVPGSGGTPTFPSPPGGLGGTPLGGPAQTPGAPSAPSPPSFPMPPGAFGAPQSQQQTLPPNSGQTAPSAPPITAPGGFGAALSALGSLVPQAPAAPATNELSRILDMPVTSETGPLPVPSSVLGGPGTPMQGPPQGAPPMPPEGLGFGPPGGFGQSPRPSLPSQTTTGGHPPVAPAAPLMPPAFGAPPAELFAQGPPGSNHTEEEEEPDGPPPVPPSGGWDFSFSSGAPAPPAEQAPSLPPPAPPAPPPMPPQMAPPMTPPAPAPATPPAPAPAAPPAVAPESNAEHAPASKGISRGISALFDEDDADDPLAEIIEAPPPQPAPAPTGRGLAGLVRRDATPKAPAAEPAPDEASAPPRSLKDAVTSAIRGAEDTAETPGERVKRPTLQSLFSDSGEQTPVASPEPKIQPVPSVSSLGLPVSQPGQAAAPVPQISAPPQTVAVPQAASTQPPQAPPAQPAPAAPAAQPTPVPTPAPQPTPPAASQAVTQPPAAPAWQPVVFSTGDPAELAKQVDDAQRQAVEGCNRIVSELDIALKGLQEAGARAMQEGNFEAVTKVMEQANRLKGVRERMAQLTQEIGSV